jgi:hypothetical protein
MPTYDPKSHARPAERRHFDKKVDKLERKVRKKRLSYTVRGLQDKQMTSDVRGVKAVQTPAVRARTAQASKIARKGGHKYAGKIPAPVRPLKKLSLRERAMKLMKNPTARKIAKKIPVVGAALMIGGLAKDAFAFGKSRKKESK